MPHIVNLYAIESIVKVLDQVSVSSDSLTVDCRKYGRFNMELLVENWTNGSWQIDILGGSILDVDLGPVYVPSEKSDTKWQALIITNINTNGVRNYVFELVTNYIRIKATKSGLSGNLSAWVSPHILFGRSWKDSH